MTVATVVVASAGLLVSARFVLGDLWNEDSHRSMKYLRWRYLHDGDPEYGLRFLNVDSGFQESLLGKTRAELKAWFPDLRPGTSRGDVCPALPEYESATRDQHEGEWISDSPWLVNYDERHRVRTIRMVKGC